MSEVLTVVLAALLGCAVMAVSILCLREAIIWVASAVREGWDRRP